MGVAALVALLAYLGSDAQATKRALGDASRTPIGDAQPGSSAKLVGVVRYLADPATAPLSGRACAYYQVIVEEYRYHNDSTLDDWYEVLRDDGGVDFLVEDDTGRARVENRSLKVAAVQDAKLASGLFRDATPRWTRT